MFKNIGRAFSKCCKKKDKNIPVESSDDFEEFNNER